MYEIKITASSVTELRGRVLALAAEMTGDGVALKSTVLPVTVVADGYSTSEPTPAPEPKPKPKAAPAPAPEPEQTAPEPEAEPEQAEDKAPEPISYERVRNAILRVATTKGRDSVTTILSHFGATKNAQEIDPSRYPEVIAMVDEMLEG